MLVFSYSRWPMRVGKRNLRLLGKRYVTVVFTQLLSTYLFAISNPFRISVVPWVHVCVRRIEVRASRKGPGCTGLLPLPTSYTHCTCFGRAASVSHILQLGSRWGSTSFLANHYIARPTIPTMPPANVKLLPISCTSVPFD